MLNILGGFDFSNIPFDSAERIHLFTEAKKLAFADRARYYADPAFQATPVDWLISKDYAVQRRQLIDPQHAAHAVDAGKQLNQGDTIYLTRSAERRGGKECVGQCRFGG